MGNPPPNIQLAKGGIEMYRFIVIVLLIISSLQLSNAQEYADGPWSPRMSYGLFGDVSYNIHSADFKSLPGIPSCCPRYESGSGLGYGFGAFLSFPISNIWDFFVNAGYYSLNGKLSTTETDGVIIFDPQQQKGVPGSFEHTVDGTFNSVGITPAIALKLGNQFRINAGIRVGYLLTKTFDQQEEVVSPSFGVFQAENSRLRNVYTDQELTDASIETALTVGASFDLPINSTFEWFLVPRVNMDYGLNDVSGSETWKVNRLTGGLAIKYSPREIIPPTPPPPPPPPPPLPPPPPPPVVPVLDASILAVGLTDDGKETNVPVLKVEEFLSTRMHPIMNYVFFGDNSAELPRRYTRMDQRETEEFSVKTLYNEKTMDVYYHVLNIVGKRMDFYPQAQVTLVGCNSNTGDEKGNLDLSKKRAETVRDYLVNTWKIDPSRIKVEAKNLPDIPSNPKDPDGIEENRRVEIIANIPQVFEPMVIRDTLREANPPRIRFKSNIKAEIGVADWKIITSQNDKNLRVFGGKGVPPSVIDWDLQTEDEQRYVPRFDEPLNYKLQITDNDAKVWDSPIQTLPVTQLTIETKMMEMIEDKEIDRFSLILFGFNKSELSKENKSISEFAKDRIQPNSIVSVSGYTDRIGDEDHNLKLSQRRADEVAKSIGVDKKFSKGYGKSKLLYNNDLPEGRFYSRTVNIEIVTPIE